MEKRLQSTIAQLGNEKETEAQEFQDKIAAIEQQLDAACQQHEEALLRAENDKQQALLLG